MLVSRSLRRRLLALLLGLVCAAAGVAVGVTAHAQAPAFDPAQTPPPLDSPLAAVGQTLYQQNCAACHGDSGQGDGPTAAELAAAPPSFADPAFAAGKTPAEWFHVTKFGRMENMMPPWGQRLSDEQIWQAVYYVWSLHTSQAETQAGAALFAESCAGCHGPGGAGDGPDAGDEPPASLADGAETMLVSNAAWDAGWQAAHPDAGAGWSAGQRQAVLEHLRTLSYIPPWEPLYTPGEAVLEGVVRQGTPGGGAVGGLPVSMAAYVDFTRVQTFTATTDEAGAFRFDNLGVEHDVVYLVDAAYGGVRYGSDIVSFADGAAQNVEITVYEGGGSADQISARRVNWIVDHQPGELIVGQIMTLGNAGDRALTGVEMAGADRPVTVGVPVPPGATGFEFQDGLLGERYLQVGDAVYDTEPATPGSASRQLFLSYRLPFSGDSVEFTQEFFYPSDEVTLLIGDVPGLKVEVEGLEPDGQDTMEGVSFYMFSSAEVPAAAPITVRLSGLTPAGGVDPRQPAVAAGATAATAAPTLASAAPWALGGAVFLALLAAAGWPLLRRHESDATAALERQQDELAQAIARLDDSLAAGSLDEAAWGQERAALKQQLVRVASELAARRLGSEEANP